ncbi:MAG: T9SS type A sorting domain-containing protein [Bacteroidetes bacterium]|nr:T9SS type A sorting domain-containing protein [Bacteroidota bacterium]
MKNLKFILFNQYPNPVTANHVNIQYRLPENSSGKMEIYDLMGRKLHRLIFTESAGTINLDLSDLPKGLYIYAITINNKPYKIDKLIVE